MERLTFSKPVQEMGMYELAHNSCYAKDKEAYYRDFDQELSARDFARELAKTFGYELSEDDEEFDYEIMDDLPIDKIFEVRELIALFYRNMWSQADLYERLKKYEELGTLEEVREAIERQQEKEPSAMLGIYGRVYECKECGNELEMYSKYCPFCGQKQNWIGVE